MKLQLEENLKQLAAEFEESLKRLDKGEHAQFAEMIKKLPAPTLNRLIKEWLPFYLKQSFFTKKHSIRPLFHYIFKKYRLLLPSLFRCLIFNLKFEVSENTRIF